MTCSKTIISIVLICMLFLTACHTSKKIDQIVQGNWTVTEAASWYDSTHCESKYHRTWLNEDRTTLYQTHGEVGPDPGNIIEIKDNYITLRYPNETRTDEEGSPLIWHMVFMGEDSYFWIKKGSIDPDDKNQVQELYDAGQAYHRCPE